MGIFTQKSSLATLLKVGCAFSEYCDPRNFVDTLDVNMCGYEDCCEAGVLERLEAGADTDDRRKQYS